MRDIYDLSRDVDRAVGSWSSIAHGRDARIGGFRLTPLQEDAIRQAEETAALLVQQLDAIRKSVSGDDHIVNAREKRGLFRKAPSLVAAKK